MTPATPKHDERRLSELEQKLARDPFDFAEAIFEASDWVDVLRALEARVDFSERAMRALAAFGVFALDRHLDPKPRCVAECLLSHLGTVRHEEAFRPLATIMLRHPQRELRIHATHALREFGHRGLDVIAGPVGGEPEEPDAVVFELRMRAALERGDSFESLSHGSPRRRRALLAALANGFPIIDETSGRVTVVRPYFDEDDPWVTFCVSCLSDPKLSDVAQHALVAVAPTRWQPIARRIASMRGRSAAPAPDPEARAKLDAELLDHATALTRIVSSLRDEGYRFVEPCLALGAPSPTYETSLDELEEIIGAIPLALARFWAVVGSVDLRGTHPRWDRGAHLSDEFDEPIWLTDPLVVVSLDEALEIAREEGPPTAARDLGATYFLDVAPDRAGKAGYSGGLLSVRCPADAVDPPLRGFRGTFLEYVRSSIEAGGFPGLAHAAAR